MVLSVSQTWKMESESWNDIHAVLTTPRQSPLRLRQATILN